MIHILVVEDDEKLNLTLKENEYFKNEERQKAKKSVLDLIKETEEYGFESLAQKMPGWIQEAKANMRNEQGR